jgi:hypothetical protein
VAGVPTTSGELWRDDLDVMLGRFVIEVVPDDA